MKWVLFFVVLGIGTFFLKRGKNNVCKTFGDYYSDRDTNPNCYYNPDHTLEVPGIVKRQGYPIETHQVTTKDGYMLTMHRIPHGLNNKNGTKKPVLLNHGLTMNSGSFLLLGKRSLGFMLADAGYDVWLGNFRGSRYSQKHKTLDTQSAKFWDFSINELGLYDVPAQIQIISEVTKQRIFYIGCSMGAAAGYVYGSTYPDLAKESIEYFVGLAPGLYPSHPFFHLFSHVWDTIENSITYITNGLLYPRPFMPTSLFKALCFPLPIQINICQIVDMIVMGYNYEENDPETLPVTLQYNSDATSSKTITHYSQMFKNGSFRAYDYGEEQNKVLYGNTFPPLYDLSKIQFDNYIVYAKNDKLTTPEGVDFLYSNLPNKGYTKVLYEIKNALMTHVDILSGKNAHIFVYKPIIEQLDRRKARNEE